MKYDHDDALTLSRSVLSSPSFYNKLAIILILPGIYLVAWLLQTQLFLSWDVSWLMLASKRLISGGDYLHNFFDPDPPLILYLSIPPVLIQKMTGLSTSIAFRLYVFGLTSLILYFITPLLNLLYPSKPVEKTTLLLAIAACLLILPASNFGQREHLMLILTVPYYLLVAARIKRIPIQTTTAILIGTLAGLGFAIKPYFYIPYLLIEISYLWVAPVKAPWRRPELWAIAGIAVTYALLVIDLHPDYWHIVLPYAMQLHYASINMPWPIVLLFPPMPYCYFVIPLSLLSLHNKPSPLTLVLLMGLIGCILVYVIQQTNWAYHSLPAFALATLLLIYLLIENSLAIAKRDDLYKTSSITLLCLILLSFAPLYLYRLCTFNIALKTRIQQFTVFMNQYASHKSVYSFATEMTFIFPSIDEAKNTSYASRFPDFWMLAGLVRHQDHSRLKTFFLDLVYDDLIQHQPDFILVDTTPNKNNMYVFTHPHGQLTLIPLHFDYLSYLQSDTRFKKLWQHYQYLTTIDSPLFARSVTIYQRTSSLRTCAKTPNRLETTSNQGL